MVGEDVAGLVAGVVGGGVVLVYVVVAGGWVDGQKMWEHGK
jgi:hypothetical protein